MSANYESRIHDIVEHLASSSERLVSLNGPDRKAILPSASNLEDGKVNYQGIEYTIGKHPIFSGCECVTWTEKDKNGIRTYRVYLGDVERAEPEEWKAQSMSFKTNPFFVEPSHYVGSGLDILVKGEERILSIRPSFVRYGKDEVTSGMHNDYSIRKDLSGVGGTTNKNPNLDIITDKNAVSKARATYRQKLNQAMTVLEIVKKEEEANKPIPPPIEKYLP